MGPTLAELVGPDYDLVTFDPRGVGNAIPSAHCFAAQEWLVFAQTEKFLFQPNSDSVQVARARDEISASQCASLLTGSGQEPANGTIEQWGGGRFMDTGSVANDLLSIVDALGETKLNYWGIS